MKLLNLVLDQLSKLFRDKEEPREYSPGQAAMDSFKEATESHAGYMHALDAPNDVIDVSNLLGVDEVIDTLSKEGQSAAYIDGFMKGVSARNNLNAIKTAETESELKKITKNLEKSKPF